MNNEEIVDKLDAINRKQNQVIGRLTMLRNQSTTGKEAHQFALEVGNEIDELINQLL